MPASMYSKDEKVLCFHHEILYDAKILDVRQKDPADKKSPLEYRVHYKGWKNTWDDWVLEDRLRKATDENRELATNIRREAEESARAKTSKSAPKKRGTSERDSVRDSEERGNSVPGRGQKRGRGDNDIETPDDGTLPERDENGQPTSWRDRGNGMNLQYMSGHRFNPLLPPSARGLPDPEPEDEEFNFEELDDDDLEEEGSDREDLDDEQLDEEDFEEEDIEEEEIYDEELEEGSVEESSAPYNCMDCGRQCGPGSRNQEPVEGYEDELDDEEENEEEEASDSDSDSASDSDPSYRPGSSSSSGTDTDSGRDSKSGFNSGLVGFDGTNDDVPDAEPETGGETELDPKDDSAPATDHTTTDDENEIEFDTELLHQEEQFHTRPSIRIVMSDNLKSLIVDDWERVSKNATVVNLPAPRPVRQILNDYKEEEAPKRGDSRIDLDVLDEVIAGLIEYFEVMLDKVLLYRYERPQYRVLRQRYSDQENFGPVAVYGAEHLLRLFSLLPELLAQTNMTQSGTNRMREELSKLSIWLSRNSEKYFRTEYVPATDFY